MFLVCYSVGILGVAGKKSKDKTVTLEKQDRWEFSIIVKSGFPLNIWISKNSGENVTIIKIEPAIEDTPEEAIEEDSIDKDVETEEEYQDSASESEETETEESTELKEEKTTKEEKPSKKVKRETTKVEKWKSYGNLH